MTRIKLIVLLIIPTLLLVACGTPETQVGKSAKTGASVGALAGLVFGNSWSDVVAGAAVGGLGGAAVGSAKSAEQEDVARTEIARQDALQRTQREDERLAWEREVQARAVAQAEYEQRLRVERERLQNSASSAATQSSWLADPDMLLRAFGEDNVTGLYALRDCQHDKAIIAASAAENSPKASYQLTSVWLRAMVAVDLRRTVSADAAFRQLIVIDPDVSTVAEAKSSTVDALAEVRADRVASGIVCNS
jgi:hypothetical protein